MRFNLFVKETHARFLKKKKKRKKSKTQGANALNNIFTFTCFTFFILLTVPKNQRFFSDDVTLVTI